MVMNCPMCDSKDMDNCDDVGRGTFQCQSCGYVLNASDGEEDFEEI